MRLIDADALMKTLGITDMDCEKCAWRNKTYPVCNRGADFTDACSAIEDAPTIEERKKGEWIEILDADEYGPYTCGVRCSECGFFSVNSDNFCPNCGADMRGDMDEHTD